MTLRPAPPLPTMQYMLRIDGHTVQVNCPPRITNLDDPDVRFVYNNRMAVWSCASIGDIEAMQRRGEEKVEWAVNTHTVESVRTLVEPYVRPLAALGAPLTFEIVDAPLDAIEHDLSGGCDWSASVLVPRHGEAMEVRMHCCGLETTWTVPRGMSARRIQRQCTKAAREARRIHASRWTWSERGY